MKTVSPAVALMEKAVAHVKSTVAHMDPEWSLESRVVIGSVGFKVDQIVAGQKKALSHKENAPLAGLMAEHAIKKIRLLILQMNAAVLKEVVA